MEALFRLRSERQTPFSDKALATAGSRYCKTIGLSPMASPALQCVMRRPRGEAADLILHAVSDAHPEGLTLAGLQERTQLPRATVQGNVRALAKAGKVETFRDDDRAVWVCLPE